MTSPASSDGGSLAHGSLTAALRSAPGLCVLTGGQTGVDTIAAIAALAAGLAVHLVFPRGFAQEDGALTAARRRELDGAGLHELAGAGFAERTWACVGLADAVILVDPAGGDGCGETARAAGELGRPLLVLSEPGSASGGAGAGDLADDVAGQVSQFLASTGTRVLMVAGCRGSLLDAAGCREFAERQIAGVICVTRTRHDQLVS